MITTQDILTQYWEFSPVALIFAALLLVFHLVFNRSAAPGKQVLFLTGILIILLVTISPLAFLGMGYLFSVHMIVHIVLLLIAPPLLLAGLRGELILRLRETAFRRWGEVLFRTPVAWLLGMAVMYVWHIPSVFAAMVRSPALHGLHVVSSVLIGMIFIWPVYAPVPWRRLEPLQSALYLFIACTGCTILGILITFAPASLYTGLLPGNDPEVWELIRNSWGVSPEADQQAGGLIMWVPACIIYITNIMLILSGYFRLPDEEEITSND